MVDNGSTEPELLRYLGAGRAQGRLRWLRRPGPFNFAALNNSAVAEVTDAGTLVKFTVVDTKGTNELVRLRFTPDETACAGA